MIESGDRSGIGRRGAITAALSGFGPEGANFSGKRTYPLHKAGVSNESEHRAEMPESRKPL
jgi:hypothetical protein